MNAGSLREANTLGVPSVAERLVVVRREAELLALVDAVGRGGASRLTVLGGGSNVVLRRRVPGTVCLIRTRGVRIEPGTGDVLVTAAAGERWHDLVRYTLGQGLAGLENLALIPGSVGAAPIQNIGAYGVELAERFVRLRALDTASGRIHVLHGRDCDFGYRDSVFKRAEAASLVILDVTLCLPRRAEPVTSYPDVALELERLGRTRPQPWDVAEAVIRIRRRKLPDPRRIGNVGSFFKNPVVTVQEAAHVAARLPALNRYPAAGDRVKLSAAQLIDAAGWKGARLGPAAVWRRQPLVLVNTGGATAADVLTLADAIRRDVADRFDVALELEPRVIGEDD
ncbi:MAG TPA: UDP-N-acetylmuramate dehydrogenase [Pseudomonadales bacterium]